MLKDLREFTRTPFFRGHSKMQEKGLSFAKQDFKPGKVPARDPSDRDLPHDLCAGLRLQIQNLSGDLEKLKI